MTISEFSDGFDTLLNSFALQAAMGDQSNNLTVQLDEYEKSVYLTEAQDMIVKEIYNGENYNGGYETNEEARRQLNSLVCSKDYTPEELGVLTEHLLSDKKYTHKTASLPDNCWYIVYEQVAFLSDDNCLDGFIADVVPITHDDYYRVRNNPFRGPAKRRVLRLDNGANQIELVSSIPNYKYTVRYLKKPEPIVLANFKTVSIDGVNTPQTCKLPDLLHRDILQKAVTLALSGRQFSQKDNK